MEAANKLLLKPITELNVSSEFLRMAKVNGFESLQNILDSPLYKLHALPESGYRMVKEFVNLLDGYGLLYLSMR